MQSNYKIWLKIAIFVMILTYNSVVAMMERGKVESSLRHLRNQDNDCLSCWNNGLCTNAYEGKEGIACYQNTWRSYNWYGYCCPLNYRCEGYDCIPIQGEDERIAYNPFFYLSEAFAHYQDLPKPPPMEVNKTIQPTNQFEKEGRIIVKILTFLVIVCIVIGVIFKFIQIFSRGNPASINEKMLSPIHKP